MIKIALLAIAALALYACTFNNKAAQCESAGGMLVEAVSSETIFRRYVCVRRDDLIKQPEDSGFLWWVN